MRRALTRLLAAWLTLFSASLPSDAITPAQDLTFKGAGPLAASINFASPAGAGVGCASLSACISDTRSTTATYINASGVLSTAAANTPRVDCSNAACGLLIEGSRTNYAFDTQGEFTSGYWYKQVATQLIADNVATSPDGAADASSFIPGTTAGNQELQQALTFVAANYSVSAYFKADGYGYGYLYAYTGTNYGAWVNFSTCVVSNVSSGATASAAALNNGWCRLILNFPGAASSHFVSVGSSAAAGTRNYAGNGTSGDYIWGVDLEQGAFPTSYIPNTGGVGTTVSRAADSMSAKGALAAALAAGPALVDMIDEATGAASRTLYAAGTFNWPQWKWIVAIYAYKKGTPASYLAAHMTYLGPR